MLSLFRSIQTSLSLTPLSISALSLFVSFSFSLSLVTLTSAQRRRAAHNNATFAQFTIMCMCVRACACSCMYVLTEYTHTHTRTCSVYTCRFLQINPHLPLLSSVRHSQKSANFSFRLMENAFHNFFSNFHLESVCMCVCVEAILMATSFVSFSSLALLNCQSFV